MHTQKHTLTYIYTHVHAYTDTDIHNACATMCAHMITERGNRSTEMVTNKKTENCPSSEV